MVETYNYEEAFRELWRWLTANGTAHPDGTAPSILTASTATAGTLANGAETAVSNTAVSVLAANTARRKLILQNTGANAVRIGIAAVTATTGMRLAAGAAIVFDMPNCPTNAIFSIRESADSTVLAQEVT
jgi:hypothetical protein